MNRKNFLSALSLLPVLSLLPRRANGVVGVATPSVPHACPDCGVGVARYHCEACGYVAKPPKNIANPEYVPTEPPKTPAPVCGACGGYVAPDGVCGCLPPATTWENRTITREYHDGLTTIIKLSGSMGTADPLDTFCSVGIKLRMGQSLYGVYVRTTDEESEATEKELLAWARRADDPLRQEKFHLPPNTMALCIERSELGFSPETCSTWVMHAKVMSRFDVAALYSRD
jgi:hypothetical protein